MKRITAAQYRALGHKYPRRTSWESYKELQGSPLRDDESLDQLVRFPGPGPLRAVLCHDADLQLHDTSFDAVFVGTPDAVWSWPGAERFGAISLLDPWAHSPIHSTIPGAYLIDAHQGFDAETALYVPDRECCDAVAEAQNWRQARELLPTDYHARLEGALVRIERYIGRVNQLSPALDQLARTAPELQARLREEFGLEEQTLTQPLYRASKPQQEALEALCQDLLRRSKTP